MLRFGSTIEINCIPIFMWYAIENFGRFTFIFAHNFVNFFQTKNKNNTNLKSKILNFIQIYQFKIQAKLDFKFQLKNMKLLASFAILLLNLLSKTAHGMSDLFFCVHGC
jgi:hypothetical protein